MSGKEIETQTKETGILAGSVVTFGFFGSVAVLASDMPLPVKFALVFAVGAAGWWVYRFDWEKYFGNAGERFKRDFGNSFPREIALCLFLISASVLSWWFVFPLEPHNRADENEFVWIMILFATFGCFVGGVGGLALRLYWSLSAFLFLHSDSESAGQKKVREQTADTDAKWATDDQIDALLKSKEAPRRGK